MTQKLDVLKMVSFKGEIGLHDLFPEICPTSAASAMYLLKLYRQGLLTRRRVVGKIRYDLSPRGRERLVYLSRKEG